MPDGKHKAPVDRFLRTMPCEWKGSEQEHYEYIKLYLYLHIYRTCELDSIEISVRLTLGQAQSLLHSNAKCKPCHPRASAPVILHYIQRMMYVFIFSWTVLRQRQGMEYSFVQTAKLS
jgi:hypothetical protein